MADCDSMNGPDIFLKRSGKSRLVRRPLKDPNVPFERYREMHRRQSESIQVVLAREAVFLEEFLESANRLIDEQLGITEKPIKSYQSLDLPSMRHQVFHRALCKSQGLCQQRAVPKACRSVLGFHDRAGRAARRPQAESH